MLEPNSTNIASTSKNKDFDINDGWVHNTTTAKKKSTTTDDRVSNTATKKTTTPNDDDLEWLKDGLETIEHEDIFETKKDVDKYNRPKGRSTLHSKHF